VVKPKIGIVLSTTRSGRFAEKPARWIERIAADHGQLDAEIVDLRGYPMPFFDGDSPIYGPPENEVARKWAHKVGTLDGLIFVTAEYNRSIPAALKNALDYAYSEFNRKPAAFVGYGGVGAARAVEHLRLICVELQMAPLRSGVHIGLEPFLACLQGGKNLSEFEFLNQSAKVLLDELTWWTKALQRARAAS
jgi:NAD(P)H-dependent FMN reductase